MAPHLRLLSISRHHCVGQGCGCKAFCFYEGSEIRYVWHFRYYLPCATLTRPSVSMRKAPMNYVLDVAIHGSTMPASVYRSITPFAPSIVEVIARLNVGATTAYVLQLLTFYLFPLMLLPQHTAQWAVSEACVCGARWSDHDM